jgi:hypothetical protein
MALQGRPPRAELPINAREAHNALAFRMMAETTDFKMPPYHRFVPASRQILVSILNQMEILQPRATILCAEAFANFSAADRSLIERLREVFGGCDVRLLCTLRRPDDYLVSWFGQEMKFGLKRPPLRHDGGAFYQKSIHFNYARMLAGWVAVFGAEALTLRNHADVMAAGGSIEDFKAQAGIAFPAGLAPVANANPSIPRALLEVARRANHALPRPLAQNLQARLLRFAGSRKLPPDRDIEMFGADNRRALVERFRPVAGRIDELTRGRPFFPDLDAMLQTRPVPEMEAARAAFATLRPALRRKSPEPELRAFLDGLDLKDP